MFCKRFTFGLFTFVLALALAVPAYAQNNDARSNRRRGGQKPTQTEQMQEQTKKIEEQAKSMGPWENQAFILQEAHQNMFRRYGWNSEADQFSLGLINQLTQVAPWNPKQREEIFMNAVQNRYGLTQDQKTLVADEMKRETTAMTTKYFKDLMPIVMEAAQTRFRQEPFTADQVQKWAEKIQPLMGDGLNALQRVSNKLEDTMTPDQKKKLELDMKDIVKRHHDVEHMVGEWRAGKWNPTDWGLDNDPIHAAAMADYRAKLANKAGATVQPVGKRPDIQGIAANESAWEKYVQWFCEFYECNDRQRAMAQAILKDSVKRAVDYQGARGKDIDQAMQLSKTGETQAKKDYAATEVQRLQKPIRDIFDQMCDRLEKTVLTSEQLAKKGPAVKPDDKKTPVAVQDPKPTASAATKTSSK